MTILVVGGTGTVGSEVVRQLLAQGAQVRVLTRSAEKAAALPSGTEGVVGDLAMPSSLTPAFVGIDGVFLTTPVSQTETVAGLAAVEAARAAGVRRLVYMTVHLLKSGLHIPAVRAKAPVAEAIEASGIPYTFLEPNSFFQSDLWLAEAIVRHKVYPLPLGRIGLNRVDIRDIADAATNALLQSGHEGRSYPLVGPDCLTGPRVAEIYGHALEHEVHYTGDDLDAFAARARQVMPEWLVQDLLIMYRHFLDHGLVASAEDLDRARLIVGHALRRFEDFVEQVFLPSARIAGR